jgi:5-methylcytosine-specific restriction protein A
MKLQILKNNLQPAASSATPLAQAQLNTVERVRGWRGVRDRNRIRERDCGLCQQCLRGGSVSVGAAVDHIVPLWRGGSDDDSNKELLCQPCHDAKSAVEASQRAAGWAPG